MIPQWVIEKKRDGGILEADDIRAFMEGYTAGTIPDYQMAALAMAIFFRGMTPEETAVLTDAMMRSGDCVTTAPHEGHERSDQAASGSAGMGPSRC